MTHQLNRKALKKSFLSSFGRLIGVALGAGAGGLIHQLVGNGTSAWGIAIAMAITSFALIWFTEYEREIS